MFPLFTNQVGSCSFKYFLLSVVLKFKFVDFSFSVSAYVILNNIPFYGFAEFKYKNSNT